MQANVGVALVHNALWAGWAYRTARAARRHPPDPVAAAYARPWEPVAVLSGFMVAGALELFDFPPLWRAVDAHALWHAATVVIVDRWYAFLLRDARAIDLEGRKAPRE